MERGLQRFRRDETEVPEDRPRKVGVTREPMPPRRKNLLWLRMQPRKKKALGWSVWSRRKQAPGLERRLRRDKTLGERALPRA